MKENRVYSSVWGQRQAFHLYKYFERSVEAVCSTNSMSWYAMFVRTGYENYICDFIDKLSYSIFNENNFNLLVPKRQLYERRRGIVHEVFKNLFPSYVLIETDDISKFYYSAKRLPKIYNVLHTNNCFNEIANSDIETILLMINEKGIISASEAYIENDRVEVIEGPLFGREGIIKKIDKRKKRAKVEFQFDNNVHLIDLCINIIRKYGEE